MIPEDRKRRLLEIIEQKGFVKVGDLSRMLNVSEPTVRRDLSQLSREGVVARSYGGASFISRTAVEWPFDYRKSHNLEQKMYMAGLAVEYVRNSNSVFLDGGSSCYCVAKAMTGFSDVHVVTGSIPALEILGETEGIEVNATGGRYHHRRHALYGPEAMGYIERHRADVFFLGAYALVEGCGVMQHSEEDAALKRRYSMNADKTVVLLDSTKFGQKAMYQAIPFENIDAVVCDRALPESLEKECEKYGIEVVY